MDGGEELTVTSGIPQETGVEESDIIDADGMTTNSPVKSRTEECETEVAGKAEQTVVAGIAAGMHME